MTENDQTAGEASGGSRERLRQDAAGPLTIDSRELFSASKEVQIRHEDKIYRLRLTSKNRLILTT